MSLQIEKRAVEIIVNGTKAGASIKELEKDVRVLAGHIKSLKPGSEDFVKASKKFKQVETELKQIKEQAYGTKKALSVLKNEFFSLTTSIVGGNLITSAFEKLAGVIPNAISGAAKLSDSFADIRKTTGMTAEEVTKLNSELGKINTRTSRQELRDIAVVAGQLGIATQDILAFTDATDKLVVALGDDFGGGAEEVTKVMGGLRNVFTDIKTDEVDKDMLKIGNALNELGASGAATAPVVADFANRIGGVGITMGLTSGQVLGLSATLQELNVSTERGGTAVVKILQKMLTNTGEFASVAGMSTQEFTDLLNNDLFGAFTKVAEGSQKSAGAATEFAGMLDNLKVDGAGASEVFAKLGANTDKLAEKVALASVAITGADSVMSEFNLKNTNMAAKVEKLGKEFNKLMNAPGLTKFLEAAVDRAIIFIEVLKSIPAFVRENRTTLIALGIALAALKFGKSADEMRKLIIAFKQKTVDVIANTTATIANARASQLATSAWKGLGKAFSANPFGFIITSVMLLVGGLEQLYNRSEKVRNVMNGLLEAAKTVFKNIAEAVITYLGGVGNILVGIFTFDINKLKEGAQSVMKALNPGNLGKDVAKSYHDGYNAESKKKMEEQLAAEKANSDEQIKIAADAADEKKRQQIEIQAKLSEEEKKFLENSKKLLKELEDTKISLIKDEEKRDLAKLAKDFERHKIDVETTEAEAKIKSDLLKALEEQHEADVTKIKDKYKKERDAKDYNDVIKNEADRLALQKLHVTIAHAEGTLTKQQYNEKLKELELDHKVELKAIAEIYGKDTVALEQDIADKTIAMKETTEEKIKRQLQARIELKRKYLAKESDELLEAEKEYLEAKREQDIAYLDEFVANQILTTEEAEKAKLDIIAYYNKQAEDIEMATMRRTWEERAKILDEWGGKFSNVMGSINQVRTNLENSELADAKKLNDNRLAQMQHLHEKKLISEDEYKNKVAIINAETDKKIGEIRKKQAQREKDFAIYNVMLSGAVAIMKISGSIPFPASLPSLLAQGIITAAQLATIQSAPAPGFVDGGYTGNGFGAPDTSGYKVAGVVHEGEYVVPKWIVQQPKYFQTISMLESVRSKGYADGGHVSSTVNVGSGGEELSKALLNALYQNNLVMSQVRDYLANPKPSVAILDYDYFTESSTELNSIQQGSRLK